jgi:hypothetical protein
MNEWRQTPGRTFIDHHSDRSTTNVKRPEPRPWIQTFGFRKTELSRSDATLGDEFMPKQLALIAHAD